MADLESSTNTTGAAAAPPDIAHHEPALKKERANRIYVIAGAAIIGLVLVYGIYALLSSGKESTDDSQVMADVVPVAARVSGQILNVTIHENQAVHKGDLLAEIDPQDATVRVAQAQADYATAQAQAAQADAPATVGEANARGAFTASQAGVEMARESVDSSGNAITEAHAALKRAEASADKASKDWARASELGGKGDISHAQVDAARAANEAAQADLAAARARVQQAENQRQAAEANVQAAQGRMQQSSPVAAQVSAAHAESQLARAKMQSAQASLQAAQLALSYTKIYAPADGIASKLAVHPGSLVAVGQPIVQLVPRNTYVVANFKETQMTKMRPGQKAEVKVDMLGRRTFEGEVESLSGGTGASFSLLPPDNASGNFVKVVQRVPVRIRWKGPTADQVPAGSSAEVTVFTK